MTVDWKRLRRSIFDPASGPLVSLVAAYALSLSANLASNLLQPHGSIALTIILGAPALIVLVIALPRLARGLSAEESTPFATFQRARKHRWLVALASPPPGLSSAEAAIRYHLPVLERVHLLCSPGEPPGSYAEASKLKEKLSAEGLLSRDQVILKELSLAEFEDLEAIRRTIEDIYSHRPAEVAEEDVVIDITGGRKTTTAGAFLAGLPRGRHLEYVSAEAFNAQGYVVKAGEPYEIRVDYSVKRHRPR
ncbi:MAG TPA: hypothetical protein VKY89_14450 [Thermoanaerobaculia bacterium]|jgi:hypothetical protein|nr:hypothetical protein [Thermoanaerobaculia bacterium]